MGGIGRRHSLTGTERSVSVVRAQKLGSSGIVAELCAEVSNRIQIGDRVALT